MKQRNVYQEILLTYQMENSSLRSIATVTNVAKSKQEKTSHDGKQRKKASYAPVVFPF